MTALAGLFIGIGTALMANGVYDLTNSLSLAAGVGVTAFIGLQCLLEIAWPFEAVEEEGLTDD